MDKHTHHKPDNPHAADDERVAAIARELGLDDREIAARKAFLELDEDDVALLRQVHVLVDGDGDVFTDTFYQHVLAIPELRELVRDDATAQRLRRSQHDYFRSLTAGDYGADYIRNRLRVGVVHQRIGLEPKWYIGGYRKYLAGMLELLSRRIVGDPQRLSRAYGAVLKMVCFDMGLALDTYAHANQRSVLQYQNYLEQVIDGMPAGLAVVGADGRVRSMNRAMSQMLGVADDAIAAHPPLAQLLPCPLLERRAAEALASGAAQDGVPVAFDSPAGGVRWFEFNIRRTRQAGEHLLLLIGQDVTYQAEARLRLQESEEFFRLTFTQAAVGIALLSPDGRFLRVNRKLSHIVGFSEAELLQCRFDDITWPEDLAEDRAQVARLVAGELRDFQRETRYVRKDGQAVWVALSCSTMREAAGGLRLIAAVEDISRRKQAEEALLRLANHDALTGLPNRTLLQDRLEHAIVQAQRNGAARDRAAEVGVMFIDLDRFKHINDSLGHDAGDRLIIEIARRLGRSLRESDTVARQGGDEFVVVLPELAGPEDAARVAQKVLDHLFQPLTLSGQEVFPTGSIGIAMYPRDGADSGSLLKAADSAMYRAKASGGNHFHFYAAAMGTHAHRHLRLETGLQRGLLREEFVLHYQPQVDIASGRIVGLEALLRWQPRGGDMVAPSDFIPLAEETGLIVPIGEWVLATALRQQARLESMGLAPLRMGVNMSARQFREDDVAGMVARLLRESGCSPSCLTLEITESVLMENPAQAAETMARLAQMGVRLSIDDFGTGYSSLANLRRLPIHSLKIDRSFVADIGAGVERGGEAGEAGAGGAIVQAVIALAGTMKLDVIAEGVESAAQQAFLGEHGCRQMQGYWFSRPLPAPQLERLLQAHGAGAQP
ncbi:EAL domain-containing protein [Massilia forsythiae]|uniref:Diguanylate cyclase DosC n=1 Tax=Massilia forsythiae TaxID=2728020 RepID=A0A7Z2VWV2_9BURK|nr:EAL domain-containing protein [Massilia forsythiae]QJE00916.1 EAL domain-containing protein [Massilia forsythiae]